MTSLPEILFDDGSQTIVEGSVVWLYCQVNSTSPNLTVTWTRDSVPLVQDAPHLRVRSSSDAISSTLLLVVDNFVVTDNGAYQCAVMDGGNPVMGTTLTLTGLSMWICIAV